MTKLKKKHRLWQKSNSDKTQKLKLWQNLQTQIVTRLINSNCDQTKKKMRQKLANINCDTTKKLKLWQNSRSQIVTKLKKTQFVPKLKNSNCDKTIKEIIVTKKSNSDKTHIVTKLKNSIATKLTNSNFESSYSDSSISDVGSIINRDTSSS